MTPATSTDTTILSRIGRGGMMISETELRYQLRNDPSAGELLEQLADLEAKGMIESQLYFRLTEAGEANVPGERPPRNWVGIRPGWSWDR
jgi:hypothetical protein